MSDNDWRPGDQDRRRDGNGAMDMLDRRLRAMEERFDRKLDHVGEKVDTIKTLPPPVVLAAVATVPDKIKTNTWATLASAAISGLVALAVAYMGIYQVPEIHELVNSQMSDALAKIERLEAKVELLGGPVAPPTRQENKEATGG